MGALRAFPTIEEESPIYDVTPKRAHLTMVRDDVFDTIGTELGGSALMVYMALERRANAKGVCSPSYDTIAESLKVTRRHVINQMKRLSDAGYVQIEQRRGGDKGHLTNNFTLPHHPTRNEMNPSELGSLPPSEQGVNKDGKVVNVVHPPSEHPSEHPSELGSPKVVVSNSEVIDESDMPSETAAPEPEAKTPSRIFQVADWYAKRIGGVIPGKGAREWAHAKQLSETPITDDELGELFDWLMAQSWVESVSLGLMASKYNEWRSSKQAKPKKRAYNDPRNANGFVG